MTRTEKYRELRADISKGTIETINYNLDYIADKLTEISSSLEKQSESLYHIAKYDEYKYETYEVRPYEELVDKCKDMFDEKLDYPMKLLERLEIRK